MSIFGLFFPDFHEAQLFDTDKIISQKSFHILNRLECRYLEDNFLVQRDEFCVHEYKIRFCKKNFTFPPTPESLFLETMHNIWGSCAAMHDDRFTNLQFS